MFLYFSQRPTRSWRNNFVPIPFHFCFTDCRNTVFTSLSTSDIYTLTFFVFKLLEFHIAQFSLSFIINRLSFPRFIRSHHNPSVDYFKVSEWNPSYRHHSVTGSHYGWDCHFVTSWLADDIIKVFFLPVRFIASVEGNRLLFGSFFLSIIFICSEDRWPLFTIRSSQGR